MMWHVAKPGCPAQPVLLQTFNEMDLTKDGVINPEEWLALVQRNPGACLGGLWCVVARWGVWLCRAAWLCVARCLTGCAVGGCAGQAAAHPRTCGAACCTVLSG